MNLKKALKDSINTKKKLIFLENKINHCIKLISSTIINNRKILICGNGGSASDAQHLATEFLIRLRPKVNRRSFPVIALAQDASTITACGNDIGFENIFSRNLEGLGQKGDTLIAISTSGNSKNILKVLKLSKKLGIHSISFLGSSGGKAKNIADIDLIVESNTTARIQESHIFLGHVIFEAVENILIKNYK
jgi:D-sedoheptulose 7-phosphate isomerase